ncbi:MAG: glycerol-3-phosphate acyltransferase [Dehalococcoidia bacterium]|nr:glycerol-3-phosphate acyltransferase [Dehalococcoidia bacterium]MDD5493664.1 glycerol-3-phosphate acyltransferase [Dehalococcoidia bacterium]
MFWAVTGLVLGSLPFSYWIGRIFLRKDIRQFGDGAPGATNVARAGSKVLYIIAVLLDAFKGSVPVWLAQLLSGITGWELAVVAVCPVLGHAFSPFLRFKGGMGVATTFGVWLGLLNWLGPIVMGLCVGFMFIFQKNWVWSTIGGMLGFLIFLIVMQYPVYLPVILVGHTAILFFKRYQYFTSWPEPQPWLGRLVRKSS